MEDILLNLQILFFRPEKRFYFQTPSDACWEVVWILLQIDVTIVGQVTHDFIQSTHDSEEI